MAIYDKQDCVSLVITRRTSTFKRKPYSLPRHSSVLNIAHKGLTRQQARAYADKLEKFKHVFRVQVFVTSGGFI